MRLLQRFLIPSVILFFCFIFYLPAVAQEKLTEIVKKILPSTVVVLTYDKNGKNIAQGSGFFISKNGDIITNKHVLAGAHRAEIKTARGKDYPITLIVAEDEEADIIRASVNIPVESVRPLLVSGSIPEVGERIAVIGSPMGLEQTVSDGLISAVREIPTFGKIYQITAPISPGSSGSPVVNMKGEVIGIATFQLTEGQNLNFALPGERIAKLKAEKGKSLNQWNISKAEEGPASAKGLYSSGLNFLWAGDYEKALPYFEKAVEKSPRYAEAYFQIGYCNGELRRYGEAIEAYKQAIRIKPDDAEAHYNLGWNYARLGLYTEAIEAYRQAIRIKPDYTTQTIEAYKQAIRIKPDDAEAHWNLGWIYGELGLYTEAIEAYKQAIHIKPDYAEAHCNLGWDCGNLGRYGEAIDAFKQAIRIKPDYAEAYYYLGVTYGNLGRYGEAIEAYRQAIHIKPDYVEAHYNLGLTYSNIGDKGFALDQYKILKKLDSDRANRLFNFIYK